MIQIHRANCAASLNLIAHRGYAVDTPQNSIPSFTEAGRLGYWAIETDVRKSADGVLVCCHDATVDSMFQGSGAICEMTLQQLRSLSFREDVNNGCTQCGVMPTFEEYLQICREYACIPFIETKTADIAQVLEMACKYFAEDEFVVSSCQFSHLEDVRQLTRKVFIHHIFSDELRLLRLSELGNAGLSYNYPDYTQCPKELIDRTHAASVKLCLRAGDTPEAVCDMLALGLDYIPTNRIYTINP